MKYNQKFMWILGVMALAVSVNACKPKGAGSALSGNAAERVYVAPGETSSTPSHPVDSAVR